MSSSYKFLFYFSLQDEDVMPLWEGPKRDWFHNWWGHKKINTLRLPQRDEPEITINHLKKTLQNPTKTTSILCFSPLILLIAVAMQEILDHFYTYFVVSVDSYDFKIPQFCDLKWIVLWPLLLELLNHTPCFRNQPMLVMHFF